MPSPNLPTPARSRRASVATLLALLLVVTLGACNSVKWPDRSPVTDAYNRDPTIALPAIAELGRSERGEAVAVLQNITQDPDPRRREAAIAALRERQRRLKREESTESLSNVRAEIEAQHSVMEAKLRAGDLKGVAAHYASDGVLLGRRGMRVSGRAEIDAYWNRVDDPLDWELILMDLEGRDGLYVERGRSKLTTLREGAAHITQVDYMLVWQRQADGNLLITVDAYW